MYKPVDARVVLPFSGKIINGECFRKIFQDLKKARIRRMDKLLECVCKSAEFLNTKQIRDRAVSVAARPKTG